MDQRSSLGGVRVLEGLAVLERVGFPGAGGERVDVREVRRFLRGRLDGTGLDMGDLDLVASEIVTNAVTHSASGGPGGRLLVSVLVARDRVRLEFTDDGGAFTRPGIPPCPDEGGRGLLIVSGLADMWGWDVGGDGRLTVWAELLRGVGQADVRR